MSLPLSLSREKKQGQLQRVFVASLLAAGIREFASVGSFWWALGLLFFSHFTDSSAASPLSKVCIYFHGSKLSYYALFLLFWKHHSGVPAGSNVSRSANPLFSLSHKEGS